MLSGLAVGSNQVRMLHTEQVLDVGGPIELTADGQLINRTGYELFDAFVVDKSDAGTTRIATVGPCPSESAKKLRFREESKLAFIDELPMQTARMMLRLASPAAIASGSTRLVARIDASLPGMQITPNANQSSAQTIVLAHLKHAQIPVPQVDVNLIGDLRPALGRPENKADKPSEKSSQESPQQQDAS